MAGFATGIVCTSNISNTDTLPESILELESLASCPMAKTELSPLR